MPRLIPSLVLLLALAASAEGPIHLEVKLARAGDNAAVRGVRVHLDQAVAVSDFDGVATFPLLEAHPRTLSIHDLEFHFVDRELTADETKGVVAQALDPIATGNVSVVVTLVASQDPVPGAHVLLERKGTDYAPVRIEAWADFEGKLVARDVPCGAYVASVTAAGCVDWQSEVSVETGDSAVAIPIEAERPTATIEGTIVDGATGTPIANARAGVVASAAEWKAPDGEAASDASGAFRIAGVPSGLRRLAGPASPATRRALVHVAAEGYTAGVFPVEFDETRHGRLRALLFAAAEAVLDQEPNSTIETAQLVPPTAHLRMRIDPVGDQDFFLLALPTDGVLTVRCAAAPIALYLRLYEARRGTVLAELGVDVGKQVEWPHSLRARAYVLSVEHWGNGEKTPGDLPLDLEFHPAPDAAEANDDPGNAVAVDAGERWSGFLLPQADLDLQRAKAPIAGVGRYVVSALPVAQYVHAFDVTDRVLAERGVDAGKEISIDFSVPSPQPILLQDEVWGRGSASATPYEARYEFVPGDAGEKEARNETLATATPIEPGGLASGTLNPVGDLDWYRVRVAESGMLHVRVSALPIGMYVHVTDGSGRTIGEQGVDVERAVDVWASLPTRGAYAIEIENWGRGAWSSSPYLLRTEFFANDPRDRRDNGTAPSPITFAGPIEGRIGFVGDRDLYRIHLPARGVLHTSLGRQSIARYLRVLGTDGKTIAERGLDVERDTVLDASVYRPGWQVVSVENWGNGSWAREGYRLEETADLEDPLEPNDEASRATRLPSRTALPGTILPEQDLDFYSYYAEAKDRYRVTVTATDVAKYVRLLDATGKAVAEQGFDKGREAVVEWDVPAPGQYTIQIESWGRGAWSAAHHQIHAERASEAAPPVAHLEVAPSPTSRHTVTLTPSAEGPAAIVSWEIDANGDGVFERKLEAAAAFDQTYASSGWVTARLRVTDASGAVGLDYATFCTQDPADRRGVQVEVVRPAEGASVDAPFDAEVLAWREDGGPVASVELQADGVPVARWFSEPYEARIDPTPWAGRTVKLAAVAGEGRAEASIAVAPLVNLSPPDGALFTSAEVAFEWDTAEEASSQVKVVGPLYSHTFDGDAGRHHRVVAKGLEQGKEYVWMAMSGESQSPARELHLVRGIEFVDRSYAFSILRDYDQRGSVRVVNHSEANERLRLHVASEQKDLLVGFVGEGSPDTVIELAPGEFRDILIVMSAQDALEEKYEFPITLEGIVGTGGEVHTDVARVQVAVKMPRLEFEVTAVSQDPGTLAWDIAVVNHGEKVTDFRAWLDEGKAYLAPSMDHVSLDAGATLRFQAVPILSESFASFTGKLHARAIHVEKEVDLAFALPEGKKVILVTIDPGEEAKSEASYCTNRPSTSVTLPLPNGPQIGQPVRPQPPSGPPKPRDLASLRAQILAWIQRHALNPKHEKILRAILDRYIYLVGDHYEGDVGAAVRALMDSLSETSRAELSTWERFLSDTTDPGEKSGAQAVTQTEAELVSDLSDVSSLMSKLADVMKFSPELVDLAREAESIQRMLGAGGFKTLAELEANVAKLNAAIGPAMEFLNRPGAAVTSMATIQKIVGRLGQAKDRVQQLTALANGYKEMMAGVNAAAATSQELRGLLSTWGDRISVASLGLGIASRYQALIRKGYDPAAAFAHATASAAIYQVATSTPIGAGIDLAQTLGDAAGVPGTRDRSMAGGFDMIMEMVAFGGYAWDRWKESRELGAAMNALPMDRIRASLARLDGRIGKATDPAEIARLRKLQGLLNQILAEKEADP